MPPCAGVSLLRRGVRARAVLADPVAGGRLLIVMGHLATRPGAPGLPLASDVAVVLEPRNSRFESDGRQNAMNYTKPPPAKYRHHYQKHYNRAPSIGMPRTACQALGRKYLSNPKGQQKGREPNNCRDMRARPARPPGAGSGPRAALDPSSRRPGPGEAEYGRERGKRYVLKFFLAGARDPCGEVGPETACSAINRWRHLSYRRGPNRRFTADRSCVRAKQERQPGKVIVWPISTLSCI